MATIAISDLQSSGYEFFSDSESYLNELSDSELNNVQGGSCICQLITRLTRTPRLY